MFRRWGRAGVPAGTVIMALAVASSAVVSLAGCDSADSGAATSAAGVAVRKPDAAASEMVTAVSTTRGPGVVELKFALAKAPKVGEPVEIEFSLLPSIPLERLFARFQAGEGLQLVSGGETEHLENAPMGVAVGHKVTVLPQSDGIFYVTAVVLADSDKDSVARTFTVPLIAGQGLLALPTAPAAVSTADTQRKVER